MTDAEKRAYQRGYQAGLRARPRGPTVTGLLGRVRDRIRQLEAERARLIARRQELQDEAAGIELRLRWVEFDTPDGTVVISG